MIDNSDPDAWEFPVGTRMWKEFVVDGRPVETRMIHRFGPGPDDFVFAAYVWDDDGEVARAYRWPLRGRANNAAPLALARMVPDTMDHPSIPALTACRDFVEAFEGPSAIVWTAGAGRSA